MQDLFKKIYKKTLFIELFGKEGVDYVNQCGFVLQYFLEAVVGINNAEIFSFIVPNGSSDAVLIKYGMDVCEPSFGVLLGSHFDNALFTAV